MAQMVKNLPATWETRIWFLDQEDSLEKGMATHSSILAWRTPWSEDPGRLQSMRSQRVGHDWATELKWTKGVCVCLSCSVVSDSLWPQGLKPARLLWTWNSLGKKTRVGSHSLLQGIFLTQGLNLSLLHCRQILYDLNHQGSPTITILPIKIMITFLPIRFISVKWSK